MLPYSFGPIFIRFVGGFEGIPKIVLQLIDNFETTLETQQMQSNETGMHRVECCSLRSHTQNCHSPAEQPGANHNLKVSASSPEEWVVFIYLAEVFGELINV